MRIRGQHYHTSDQNLKAKHLDLVGGVSEPKAPREPRRQAKTATCPRLQVRREVPPQLLLEGTPGLACVETNPEATPRNTDHA